MNLRNLLALVKRIASRYMQGGSDEAEKTRIIEGTFHSFIIQGISVGLVFLGNLLLTRWAGPAAYGTYVHVFNWVSILSIFAIGGREDLAISEITQYRVSHQPERIFFLVRGMNVRLFTSSLLVTGTFLLLIYLCPLRTLHEYRQEFLLASGAIYLTAFLTTNQQVLQALDRIRLSQLSEKLVKPALLVLFGAILWITGWGMEYKTAALILVVLGATLLCCLLLAGIVAGKVRVYRSRDYSSPEKEDLRRKSFLFFSITLLTLLVTKISMLLLPYFAPQQDIGFFNVCYRFADLIIYPFFLMHSVLPQLFARHAASERTVKQSLYSDSTKLMLLLSLPLLAINILAGRWFLGWFGDAFRAGYPVLVLLSLAQFLFAVFGPASTILMMQHKEKYAVYCLLAYVLLLLLSNLILIPRMGMIGAAAGMLCSTLLYNVILSVLAYRLSGVCSPFFSFLIKKRS